MAEVNFYSKLTCYYLFYFSIFHCQQFLRIAPCAQTDTAVSKSVLSSFFKSVLTLGVLTTLATTNIINTNINLGFLFTDWAVWERFSSLIRQQFDSANLLPGHIPAHEQHISKINKPTTFSFDVWSCPFQCLSMNKLSVIFNQVVVCAYPSRCEPDVLLTSITCFLLPRHSHMLTML